MEEQRTNEANQETSFEQSVSNTRLENQPNELLASVKARVLEQGRLASKEGQSTDKTQVSA
jgi:hypothetical protein